MLVDFDLRERPSLLTTMHFVCNKDTGATDAQVAAIQRQVRLHGGTCDLVQYADGDHGLHGHRDDMFTHILLMLEQYDTTKTDG